MRKKLYQTILLLALFLFDIATAHADFSSGSTGADGAFNPSTNTVLDVPVSGIFNYTTVNIPAGVTVTFRSNAANTPVTILATGDVTIAGSINVNGTDGVGMVPGKGGPGGYGGGIGGALGKPGTAGNGPGGGGGGGSNNNGSYASCGGGGGYGVAGGAGANYQSTQGRAGIAYGNERILPLIGGSGGGGGGGTVSYAGTGGGGGGGALLIASSGTIAVTGIIYANGGGGSYGSNGVYINGGGGSGGAIRLIANIISGNGSIQATGGLGGASGYTPAGGNGGNGRIRLETFTMNRTNQTTPIYVYGIPSDVIPTNMPVLLISKIAGITVPSVPNGSFEYPDVQLPSDTRNPVSVEVAGANIPVGTTITVSATPQVGNITSGTAILDGTDQSSRATAQVNISTAYPNIFTVTATYTLSAMLDTPVYFNGERIEKVRVTSVSGEQIALTYITETGREIPGSM